MEGIVGYEQEKKGSRKRKPEARHERESQGQDPHKFHTLLEWIF